MHNWSNHVKTSYTFVFFFALKKTMLTRSNILNLGKLWFQAINIKIIGYSKPKFANFKSTMLTQKFVN